MGADRRLYSVWLLLSFLFQPIGSVGSLLFIRPFFRERTPHKGRKLQKHTSNFKCNYPRSLPVAPSQESLLQVHLIVGALNLPRLVYCPRWDVKGMAESINRSAEETEGSLAHPGGGRVKLSHTKGHERFSADPKEKGNKNQKGSFGENCRKGSSRRNGITKRPVTG